MTRVNRLVIIGCTDHHKYRQAEQPTKETTHGKHRDTNISEFKRDLLSYRALSEPEVQPIVWQTPLTDLLKASLTARYEICREFCCQLNTVLFQQNNVLRR